MALPKAAQQQIEAAEALHKQVYEGDTPPEEKPVVEEVKDEKSDEPKDVAAAPEGDTPPTGEKPPVEAPPQDSDKLVDWEQKYKVLQGKYDAEVPRLTQTNQALQGRVGEMETQMQSLMARFAEAGGGDGDSPTGETPTYLKPDEIEDYGDELISVMKRAAREEFEPQISSLQQENEQLRGLLGGMQQASAMSARDQMIAQLDTELPNWRELNGHPDVLAWLENVDVYSGQRKLDLLRQAFENNNTTRVLAFFKGFLNENAAMAPSTTPSEPAEPTVGLDTLVAPGSAKDGGDSRAQEGAPQGPTWSQRSIAEFYRDVNRGVYRDKPEERDRLERDIFLAQQEGRLVP